MNVDGVEIAFEPEDEDGSAVTVLADGRRLGRLELVEEGSGLVAYRENGQAVQRPSPWGGPVTARFQTRELAVRALLKR